MYSVQFFNIVDGGWMLVTGVTVSDEMAPWLAVTSARAFAGETPRQLDGFRVLDRLDGRILHQERL